MSRIPSSVMPHAVAKEENDSAPGSAPGKNGAAAPTTSEPGSVAKATDAAKGIGDRIVGLAKQYPATVTAAGTAVVAGLVAAGSRAIAGRDTGGKTAGKPAARKKKA